MRCLDSQCNSAVDRAKAFYSEKVGFNVDVDQRFGDKFRFVQLTPPGSACSITLMQGMNPGMEPGSLQGVQITTSGLEAVRKELVERGVEVSEMQTVDQEAEKFVPPEGPVNRIQRLHFLQRSRRERVGRSSRAQLGKQWGGEDSNLRPTDYESSASRPLLSMEVHGVRSAGRSVPCSSIEVHHRPLAGLSSWLSVTPIRALAWRLALCAPTEGRIAVPSSRALSHRYPVSDQPEQIEAVGASRQRTRQRPKPVLFPG
jgi:hypothetical protein